MYGKLALFKRVVSIDTVRYYKRGSKRLLEFLAEMPKVKSAKISEVQRQRINVSKKNERFSPSTIYLQVLGSGARGVPNTLYIFTDHSRYLFNCGESTQRLAHEHKVRLSKLEHVFITSKTWANIGGLPGLSLTLQDVGLPNLTLHGPEGLDELYKATARFVVMKDMVVKMAPCSPSEDFNDNIMSVKYVILGPDENLLENDPKPSAKKAKTDEGYTSKAFEKFIHDNTDYYHKPNKSSDARNKNPRSKSKSPEKDPLRKKTEKVLQNLQRKSHCTVAYICTFKKRMGTLDLKKCVEFGVKPGPVLGKLKAGEDVILPDGTLILSKDVKTPDDPGPVLIVLEVPDLTYLKESEFSAHFDNGTNPPENIPAIVVHYTPPHVFNHPTYRAFMSMFGPNTRHLVLNAQNSCLGSEAVHRTQHKLHLLDADIFPLLKDASLPAVWNAHLPLPKTDSPAMLKGLEELKNKIALAQFQNIITMEGSCKGDGGADEQDAGKLQVIAGRTLSIFHLRPKIELDRSAEPKLHIQDYIQETMDVDGFVGSLEQFRKLVESVRYARNDQKEFPKLVFLGTGSCIPSKTRNTSGIVLHINENSSILLDCGEGTVGQLVRFYGPKRVNAFLRTLKAIYISHLHADHHIGLIGVLQARRQALEEAGASAADVLYLLAPGQIVSWLAIYDQLFERICDEFTLIPNQNLLAFDDYGPLTPEISPAVLAHIGVRAVSTCYVQHCPNAFAVAVEVDGEHKITYSGDTIPCDALVKLGEKSTLLIHEATMEDDLAEEARIKMHSTTSQAVGVGRRAGARHTLLTHFSQRYARLPRLGDASVGVAFDMMQVTMGDLELLPHMCAPLQLMFAEHCVELEMKAAQRALQKERLAASPKPQADTKPKVEPPCGIAASTPTHPPNAPMYRESNASRLRQEIKRIVANDRVKSSSRSKSCSPPPNKSPVLSSTPRPQSSESAFNSPEKLVDATTPRTASAASSIDKDVQEKSKGHVIDTRSKTLNSACTTPSVVKVSESKTNAKNVLNTTSPSEVGNGYGKPLVTPLNKRLVIRRPSNSIPGSEKSFSTVNRCRSPVRSLRTANRPSSSTVASNNRNLSKTQLLSVKNPKVDIITSILVHLIFWRLFHVLSCLSYEQWQLLITVVSVGVLFWTAAKDSISGNRERSSHPGPNTKTVPKSAPIAKSTKPSSLAPQRFNLSPRRASSADRKPQDTRSLTSYNKPNAYNNTTNQRNLKSWNSDPSSPAKSSPRSQTPTGLKQRFNKIEARPDAIIRSSASSREKFADRLRKPNITKDIKKPLGGGSKSKCTNHSSKSFKPQLEDIKSSYLLLNKKKIDRNINAPANNEKLQCTPKPKPSVINDNNRRAQLLEIKQKFKSKRFWNDSKYDKIEGLNWITWK